MTLRGKLAAHRAAPLLAALRARPSRSAQLQELMASSCMYSPMVGWTGGPFDLEILLEDPKFRIPWRTRHSTERMIAEAKAFVLRSS